MSELRPVGLIVDGYGGGSFLPPAFGRHGHDVAHVQSTPMLRPRLVAPQLDAYRCNIVNDDEYAQTLRLARALAPAFVLAGQEPGIPFADRLSEDLGVRSNGSAGSSARRNKFDMIDKIAAAGLHCAVQHLSPSPQESVVWAARYQVWPCVVKPQSSAATDLVRICHDEQALARAVRTVLEQEDIFGDRNETALVQSFLDGTEYIVDTVSADSQHYVCGVWRYHKSILPDGSPVYDRDDLMPEEECDELIAYTRAVLDVLGVANGPAHSEVMVTAQGPALVELGARLNGNMDPGFHDVCIGSNQADLTALCYTDPTSFVERFGGGTYTRCQPAVVYNTATERQGTVRAVDDRVVSSIADRPSVHEVEVKHGAGDTLTPTRDLMTSPIRVFLTSPDSKVVESDYAYIKSVADDVYHLR